MLATSKKNLAFFDGEAGRALYHLKDGKGTIAVKTAYATGIQAIGRLQTSWQIRLDLNGDGKVEPTESLWRIFTAINRLQTTEQQAKKIHDRPCCR